jgi:hypothetical protein
MGANVTIIFVQQLGTSDTVEDIEGTAHNGDIVCLTELYNSDLREKGTLGDLKEDGWISNKARNRH